MNLSQNIEFLIQEAIRTEVSKQVSSLKSQLLSELREELINNTYLTRKEVADYTKSSLSTVDNMVKAGLKKYKLYSKTLFKKIEVDEYIEKINS